MNLHPVNDKTTKIKRYPDEIIKFFQKNYPENTDFSERLFEFHHQLFYAGRTSVLLIDIDSDIELLAILYLHKSQFTDGRLHIRILSHDFEHFRSHCSLDLKNVQDQHLQSSTALIRQINPSDISGWQRFKFNDGKYVIDLFPCTDDPLSSDYPLKARQKVQAVQFGLGFDPENISHAVADYVSHIASPSASVFIAGEHPLSKALINVRTLTDPLRRQNHLQTDENEHNLCPVPVQAGNTETPVAIIGGGLASVHLALSLAERGRSVTIFCKDDEVAQGASGNKQGALYPLLTPENSELSRFFQQAFLFSRKRIAQLNEDGFKIDHDFCGVVQTGHDARSTERLDKILQGQAWPADIVQRIDAEKVNAIAGVDIDKAGAFYPLAGWVCPFQYTQAALAKARSLSDVSIQYQCKIERLERTDAGWLLCRGNRVYGPFEQVVNACGSRLTGFSQTQALPASNFRGQVSHVPSRPKIAGLKAVICAHGYMTPASDNLHCVGASYVRLSDDRSYQPVEQLDNLKKMRHSYPDKDWVNDIDISGHDARVGVRMVTRDHFPMLGCAPDREKLAQMQKPILNKRKSYVERYWKNTRAPVIEGLYVLGALGSRGLCSGPLAAEVLASLLCNEIPPVDYGLLKKLNPNRMWIRKIEKNKPIC